MKFKIIVDSSSDMTKNHFKDEEIGFEIIPLTINVNNHEFLDDENLDCKKMLDAMHNFNGKSTSSCPPPQKFIDACTADYNFIITITSKLSGTFNCANLAASSIINKKCFVIDSKATSGSIALIAQKIYSLIKEEKEYDEICEKIIEYRNNNKLFFILDDFDNLIKNGRMSKFTAAIARIILIKPICIADNGEIKIYKKVRTRKTAITKMIDEIANLKNIDFTKRECIISHCLDYEEAKRIKDMLISKLPFKNVNVVPMKGLCSFYALEKGIIVSF